MATKGTLKTVRCERCKNITKYMDTGDPSVDKSVIICAYCTAPIEIPKNERTVFNHGKAKG